MKAVVITKNKELIWSEVADPVLADDEVLVEVHAAAINRADLMQVEGNYPYRAVPVAGVGIAG